MPEPSGLLLAKPGVAPPLDPDFRPIALGNHRYSEAVRASGKGIPLGLALEREGGRLSVFRTQIFPPGTGHDADTFRHVERLVKFLLWARGGWRVVIGGPREVGESIRETYSPRGARRFDFDFMGGIYEKPFTVEITTADRLPEPREAASPVGGHLEGCRIGFDLGASDYKLASVVDGEVVFTTELPWDPRVEADPQFHRRKIQEGLKLAASKMPRVDAIGGSSAGVIIDNKVMAASLFRSVPKDAFERSVKPMFLDLRREWGVPLEVANDGDVTALAGAMSLRANAVLGVAMGSSQAGGYLDREGRLTGWLNELAFAPNDYSPRAPADEWSGDIGCGVQCFSQQAVVRLAGPARIVLPEGHPAGQLKHVQDLHLSGDPRPAPIFETIGVYLGYAAALYATMYDYRAMLVLGRVTSGAGGDLILKKAREVLERDFPELAKSLALHLPDEKNKRVGQAVAAASLPAL